jgi:putative nucleotidyltransferase with HDIG domain
MPIAFTPRQADEALSRMLSRATEVSTLPHVLSRILQVANDPTASAEDLGRQIETDPALAARVLKIANSVATSPRHPIRTLPQAVSLLGFSAVRNLAITAMVCEVFRKDVAVGSYSRHRLWDHMVSVAVTAKMIATRQKVGHENEIFLAGLLHDLGIVLEDQLSHEVFEGMMHHFPEELTLVEAERLHFGYDHAVLGAEIARQWNFPELICEVIEHHHTPNYKGPHARAVACVELANVMVTLHGISSVGIPLRKISPTVLFHLELDRAELETLAEQMNKEIQDYQPLRNLIAAA